MQIAMMQYRTAQHLLQPELDAAGPRRGFELPARCKRLPRLVRAGHAAAIRAVDAKRPGQAGL